MSCLIHVGHEFSTREWIKEVGSREVSKDHEDPLIILVGIFPTVFHARVASFVLFLLATADTNCWKRVVFSFPLLPARDNKINVSRNIPFAFQTKPQNCVRRLFAPVESPPCLLLWASSKSRNFFFVELDEP